MELFHLQSMRAEPYEKRRVQHIDEPKGFTSPYVFA